MKILKRMTICIIFLLSSISIVRIIHLSVINNDHYKTLYDSVVNNTFNGFSAPRGRILDTNGKVLVDNRGINSLMYHKSGNQDEINIASSLARILDNRQFKTNDNMKINYYLVTHGDGDYLISDEEWNQYSKRKLSLKDINKLKRDRVNIDEINGMSDEEIRASYIYYMMNKGYSYQKKIIVSDLSEEEVAVISKESIPGIEVSITWERVYPYGETLRTILGSVSKNSVPLEYKDLYLDRGISLDSCVGTSGIEFQYDEYLRGKDLVYSVDNLNRVHKISDETVGNDLYLSIDIDIQLEVEKILGEEIKNAKKAPNTTYYNQSFVLVGDPSTGGVVAMAGLLYNKGHLMDVTINAINSSFTVGSIVKGASMSVGYSEGLIKKGKYITDSCVKVYGVTKKCSWTSLGRIDDVRAMALSSNYYQFMIAVNMTNKNYKWNSKLNANQNHFDTYRNVFASYGLGVKTGIDLPNERIGIIGKRVSDDLLLNLTIGQYDTYTPIEILQYVNTLANRGVRLKLNLMKSIKNNDNVIKEYEPVLLNDAVLNSEDMDRLQKGLRQVMISGTGSYYTDRKIPSSGKTGTSETFVDSNGDGIMDKKTISNAFIMYAPSDKPKYSIAIISPNITTGGYKYPINLRLNSKIYKYLFEKR